MNYKKQNTTGFVTYLILVLVVIVTAFIMYSFVKNTFEKRNNLASDEVYLDSNKDPQDIKKLVTTINQYAETKEIVKSIRQKNSDVNLNKFTLVKNEKITSQTQNTSKELIHPGWLFNSTGTIAINWLQDLGQPDSSLYIYNYNQSNDFANLFYGGTMYRLWGAVWVEETKFILFSDIVSYDDNNEEVYYIVISIYDLSENKLRTYQLQLDKKPVTPAYKPWHELIERVEKYNKQK